MSISKNGINYSDVEYSTEWLDLSKYKILEPKVGVFIFSNFFYQIKFIGKSNDSEIVRAIEGAINDGKSLGSSKVKVIYTKNNVKAFKLQKRLIVKYNPPLNRE